MIGDARRASTNGIVFEQCKMVVHPAVRRVNFTGSTRVGQSIAQTCAKFIKPVLLGLGGKAPFVVLDDTDVDAAAAAAAFGASANSGQVCMSTERIVWTRQWRTNSSATASSRRHPATTLCKYESNLRMKIQAAVLHAPGSALQMETLDLERIRDDELVVRLVATGVCHTDISVIGRPFPVEYPIVLGHEGAGVVEAVGRGVTKVKVGDRVVMSYDYCGRCPSCQEQASSYCHDFFGFNFLGLRPDGSAALSKEGRLVRHRFFGQSSFATHSVCTERNVVKVSESAALETLGPLACGIQTGAGAVINVLKPRMGQSLAVFGAGSVGMAGIMAAKAIGATTIIAVDRIEERLALALEVGATHIVKADAQVDTVAEIRRITGNGVSHSLDTTGVMQVLRQAVECLAPRGTCGFVGGSPAGSELTLDVKDIMLHGKTLRGIVEGDANPDVFIPALIDLHVQGRFPFDRLITFYPFEKINEAIADSKSGKAVKPVVVM